MKIVDDKYYTPIHVANQCWEKVKNIIGLENISEVIEPSCGDGSFFHYMYMKPDFGFDIKPECVGANILTQDYLTINMPYKKNRLIIGNPPYGSRMNMAQKFFKKSVELGDYIAFILPISQYNNTQSLFEFDLIYSEDLGEQIYTDRKLHCCFNIYKRPENSKLNKRPNSKLDFIRIKRNDSKGYNELTDYDIRMCGWGDGSAGKILSPTDKLYACEYKIKILDEKNCDKIVKFFNEFDWNSFTNGIAMKRLKQFHIIDVLKKQFPELS